jgi:hypothetical protein
MMLGLALSLCSSSGGGPDHYDYEWALAAADGGWIPTDGRMLAYAFGKWWTTGGWSSEGGGVYPGPVNTTNEVWSSPDLVTWTEELAFAASPPTSGAGARFKRRHYHGFFTHTHAGTPYLYVLGGDHESNGDGDFAGSGGYQNDIWRSPDGTTWERVMTSAAAPWEDRMLQVWGSSGDALWMFGGTDVLLGGSTTYNDLWTSTDGGATWTELDPSNKPTARGIVSKLAYWNGRMWLVGGGTYHATPASRTYFRQVWSFDPANPTAWTQHANPPWLGTQYHAVEVFNDRLWVFGGFAYPGANSNVVFSTGDGEVWERHERPPWPHSHADAVAVNGSTLGFVSGNGGIVEATSGVYELPATAEGATAVTTARHIWRVSDAVTSGANITSIPDRMGSGITLVPNVAGDATYNATDADYGGAASATTNGGHFLHSSANVNQAGFTIFVVGKITDVTSGFAYYMYSTFSAQNYTYYGCNRNTGIADRVTYNFDVRRAAVSTTGTENTAYDQTDIAHVYAFHFDGTNEGSFMRVDGATVLPDDASVTGDAGTAAYTVPLYLFSDNGGTGSKAATMAECRVYPALTLAEIQAVERELRALYPYKAPT